MTIIDNNNIIVKKGSGEKMCQNKGYDQNQCLDVGCCNWNDGCYSSVGTGKCEKGKAPNTLQ